jgi:hypothetical protein
MASIEVLPAVAPFRLIGPSGSKKTSRRSLIAFTLR